MLAATVQAGVRTPLFEPRPERVDAAVVAIIPATAAMTIKAALFKAGWPFS